MKKEQLEAEIYCDPFPLMVVNNFYNQFELEMIWQLHLTALSYQPWHPKYTPHAKASHPRQDLMEEWWRLAKIVNSI